MSYTRSLAIAGQGATFGIGATPTVLGEVSTMTLSGRKMNTEDVTNLESTFEEFIATIPGSGTWDIAGNLINADAGQIALETAFLAGTLTSFTITLPKTAAQTTNGDKYVFSAIIAEKGFGPVENKKKIGFTAKLMVSGAITYTAGT